MASDKQFVLKIKSRWLTASLSAQLLT